MQWTTMRALRSKLRSHLHFVHVYDDKETGHVDFHCQLCFFGQFIRFDW